MLSSLWEGKYMYWATRKQTFSFQEKPEKKTNTSLRENLKHPWLVKEVNVSSEPIAFVLA